MPFFYIYIFYDGAEFKKTLFRLCESRDRVVHDMSGNIVVMLVHRIRHWSTTTTTLDRAIFSMA